MSNSKHGQLSLNDRINIARLLDLGNSLRKTAEIICRSVTTISSEIKTRRIIHGELTPGGYLNYNLCERLTKAPFICNGCESETNCRKRQYQLFWRTFYYILCACISVLACCSILLSCVIHTWDSSLYLRHSNRCYLIQQVSCQTYTSDIQQCNQFQQV